VSNLSRERGLPTEKESLHNAFGRVRACDLVALMFKTHDAIWTDCYLQACVASIRFCCDAPAIFRENNSELSVL
jgi:hypothetical protein